MSISQHIHTALTRPALKQEILNQNTFPHFSDFITLQEKKKKSFAQDTVYHFIFQHAASHFLGHSYSTRRNTF